MNFVIITAGVCMCIVYILEYAEVFGCVGLLFVLIHIHYDNNNNHSNNVYNIYPCAIVEPQLAPNALCRIYVRDRTELS